MYRKVLVGHDLKAGGDDALALGRELARATGADLVVANVFTVAVQYGAEVAWIQEEEERAARAIEQVASEARAEGRALRAMSPTGGLYQVAEEVDADLVIVGSSHRGKAERILAGDVALGLLHGSPCAVSVAPQGYAGQTRGEWSTIVVGYDASPEARLALDDAVELAEMSGAALKLVAVAPEPAIVYGKGASMGGYQELKESIEGQRQTELDEAVELIPAGVGVEAAVAWGEPGEQLAAASAGASLLMLGSRSYGPLRGVLLGSVSREVARHAPCPVLIHPRGVKSEPRTGPEVDARTVA